jgi:hypothetical protein
VFIRWHAVRREIITSIPAAIRPAILRKENLMGVAHFPRL